MKESLIKCIDHGYTHDPERAKKILKDQFEEQEDNGPEIARKSTEKWEPNSTKGLLEYNKQMHRYNEVTMLHKIEGAQIAK